MSLRKRMNKDHAGVSCESQQEVGETQEDNTSDDKDELSVSMLTSPAARGKRRRERENKLKPKEMTEEEMMDLALRLSKEEANITALRLQEEEEAVRMAIHDSMMSECSQSQSLIGEAPLCVSIRRKLNYSNGESQSGSSRLMIDTDGTQELSRGQKTKGAEPKRGIKKRKRAEGSPLMEMPDLSQSQPSPSGSDSLPLGSPQSCDSTQIDEDAELHKSPVFPSSSLSHHVSVQVPRLSQNLVDSCTTSGFVLCSPDSCVTSQNPQVYPQTHSPTFPKSPAPRSKNHTSTKTTASQTYHLDLGDDTEPNLSAVVCKSPVFGRNTQLDDCTRALKSETGETSGLMFSSQESSTLFCLEKETDFLKSPVFSKAERGRDGPERSRCCKSPVFGTNGHLIKTSTATLTDQNCSENRSVSQNRDKQEDSTVRSNPDDADETNNASKLSSVSEKELTSDMTLHWSEEDDDSTPTVSPSPVFPEERSVLQTNNQTVNEKSAASAQTNGSVNPPESQSCAGIDVPSFAGDSGAQATVHYYWGVPFCPRGLDPDTYTKVIVAQMEVYEKSLKQAQRRLVKKVEWGGPVLPQPERSSSPEYDSPQIHLLQRRPLRRKAKLDSPRTDEERAEMDEETQLDEEEEEAEEREKNEEQRQENERPSDERQDSDCEVCPETQLSDNDSTQDLPTEFPVKSPEIETVQVDSPAEDKPQQPENEEEMEVDVESEQGPEEPDQTKPDGVDTGGHLPESEPTEDQDLEPVSVVPRPQSSVQCPICQRPFPSADIEMHAAFCDGEPPATDPVSQRLRRKKTRRAETEETNHTTDNGKTESNQEMCYICHRAVPLKDYSRHTEFCLQRRVSRTATTGGLLSALDQSERRDPEAGPSGSRVRPEDVIDLRDEDEDEVSAVRISNSPIRSFTPISEAGDCLIDFRKQHRGKRPGPKRR